jgi:hypothetical protein
MSIFSQWRSAAVRQRRRRFGRAGQTANARRRFEALEGRQLLTVTIDGSPTIYNTIQQAINAAVAGNTVRVGAGTYAENVLVNKSISVVGATGKASDIVIDPASGVGVTITASGVTLQSLRVTGASNGIQADNVANLTFNNVNSDHNSGDGVHLTNLSGMLNVSGGAYSNNTGDGIDIASESGMVSITSTIFGANIGLGIRASNAIQQGTLNLSDLALTNNFGGAGASVASFGALSFTSTLADAADTVSLTSSQFQLTRGVSVQQVVLYSGLASLEIDTLDGADTINVASTATATATTINSGDGMDVFGDIDLTQIGLAGLTINAGSGAGQAVTLNTTTAGTVSLSSSQVQRTGNGAVAHSGFAGLTVNGTAGADTFNVASTAAGTATTINAGAGLDVFAPIDLTTIGAAGLTLNAAGNGESLEANTTATGTVSLSDTIVQRLGNGAVAYSGLASLTVNGTAGADTFNVASTAAGTVTTINGGAGLDVFAPIDLTTIGAAGLTLNAGGDGESLEANTTAAGTVSLSNTTVQRVGNGAVNHSAFASLTLNGTAGADVFNVTSTAAGTNYAINAGAANDTITIGAAGSLDGVQGQLSIDGGSNDALLIIALICGSATNSLPVGDTVYFNDSATTADSSYLLTASTFSRTSALAASVTYQNIETIDLNAGSGADSIDALATPAGSNLFVGGNGGGDTITLAANGTGSNVVLNGDAGDDVINVQSVAATSIVQVNGGDDNDTVNVSSDAPANAGTLNSIVGSLCIDTGAGGDQIILSDQGQKLLANSSVVVTDSSVTGFAGPTNNVPVFFQYEGTLQLTLIGSQTLTDKFNLQLSTYPQFPSLTLQIDGSGQPSGGMDKVRIDGTGAGDFIEVGLFGSGRPFQIQNIECLQLFGSAGDDTLRNDTNTASLIDGGDGNDLLVGGSNADVIFGGDGVDVIFGRGGNDFLFGDHEFNNRKPRVKHAVAGDYLFGDRGFDPQFPQGFDPKHPGVVTPGSLTDPFAKTAGVDTIVTIGLDFVDAGGEIGDTIIGSGVNILSVEDWLRARFLTSNAKHIQAAIQKALTKPCTML